MTGKRSDSLLSEVEAHPNYSAVLHEYVIEQTFLEELSLDLVAGPFNETEAADYCGCTVAELMPGPLGAVEEADKIRAIYDGSVGHLNDHIRSHMTCETTAPTVSDLHGGSPLA